MFETFQALIPIELDTTIGRFTLLNKNTYRVDLYRVIGVQKFSAELRLLESCDCNDEDHEWSPKFPTRCSREFVIAGIKKITELHRSGPLWVAESSLDQLLVS
jgi:hypothetical protein